MLSEKKKLAMETCIGLNKFMLKDTKIFLQEKNIYVHMYIFVSDYQKAWENTHQTDPSRYS